MKRILVIIAVLLMASPLFAGDVDRQTLSVTSGTNAATAVTDSTSKIRGKILEVYVDLTTATNVDVTVYVDPELSTMADINLYDANDVDADKVLRPAFDKTDAAGSALTGDDPVPFVVIGDAVTLKAENFDGTNKTVKAVIKYEKQK